SHDALLAFCSAPELYRTDLYAFSLCSLCFRSQVVKPFCSIDTGTVKNHAERTSVRDRLLQTADQLFYTEGLHAVGIDRIVAESKVAKSTMYVYFRTKEELIVEYLRHRSEMTRQRIVAAVDARADQPVSARVLTVFEVLDDIISEPDFRGCAFVNAAAEYPDHQGIRDAISADRRWLPRLLTGLLAEANAADPGLVD